VILAMGCLILIVGGVLIMMGQHSRSELLFYSFRLEDQIPETHLLRLIDLTPRERERSELSCREASKWGSTRRGPS
jgi:hypothetical protein